MKESSTHQAILEEGRGEGAVAEAKKVLRFQGEDAFGAPDSRSAARIEKLQDLGQLEGLLRRLPTAASWKELLDPSATHQPRGRRRRPSQ